jgi:hypothetical protein
VCARKAARALSGADVTIEAVLRRLQVIGDKALEDGQYSAAVRAAELLGKHLKMFSDRIEHVQSIEEVSTEELVQLFGKIVRSRNVELNQLLADELRPDGDNRR